jgi:predicted nucleic acid-binding protein
MKHVLDSSVAFKWVVAEADADKALRLRDDFQKAIHEMLAPDVFTAELAHALTRAERQGRLTAGEALALWTDVMTTPPQFFPSLPLTPRAIEISSQMRVGIYDCLYVALAEREKCDLIAADDKLIKNLQPHFAFIVALTSLPGSVPPTTGT